MPGHRTPPAPVPTGADVDDGGGGAPPRLLIPPGAVAVAAGIAANEPPPGVHSPHWAPELANKSVLGIALARVLVPVWQRQPQLLSPIDGRPLDDGDGVDEDVSTGSSW